ncbi:MAG: hypothetical protein WA711_00005, partial [Pseudolabrys sp.]
AGDASACAYLQRIATTKICSPWREFRFFPSLSSVFVTDLAQQFPLSVGGPSHESCVLFIGKSGATRFDVRSR